MNIRTILFVVGLAANAGAQTRTIDSARAAAVQTAVGEIRRAADSVRIEAQRDEIDRLGKNIDSAGVFIAAPGEQIVADAHAIIILR